MWGMSGKILVRENCFCKEQNMNSPVLIGRILAMDGTQCDIKFIAASGFS